MESTHLKKKPIIAVAPMMGYTDRHARYFFRLLSPNTELYTEMITTKALIYGNRDHLLAFNIEEKYVALQLGGCDPHELAQCAIWGEDAGYNEINLNVGCPSKKVKAGQFGACLMLNPELVAECVDKMQTQIKIPVSVKCRIGIDHQDSLDFLVHFIQSVVNAGCKKIIIHARKAWLQGLSPKQNREIPQLDYDRVFAIKKYFPNLSIIINGGINTLDEIQNCASQVDGVMLGRAMCTKPFLLAEVEKFYFNNIIKRNNVVSQMIAYIHEQVARGIKQSNITRHILGLYYGELGAKKWRQYLSQHHSRVNLQDLPEKLQAIEQSVIINQ